MSVTRPPHSSVHTTQITASSRPITAVYRCIRPIIANNKNLDRILFNSFQNFDIVVDLHAVANHGQKLAAPINDVAIGRGHEPMCLLERKLCTFTSQEQ